MCKKSFSKVRTDLALFSLFDLLCKINDRVNRRANHEWTIQRNWQHCMHNMKTISTKRHNTICVGNHSTQTCTNNVNKMWAFLQTIGDKDEHRRYYNNFQNNWHFNRHYTSLLMHVTMACFGYHCPRSLIVRPVIVSACCCVQYAEQLTFSKHQTTFMMDITTAVSGYHCSRSLIVSVCCSVQYS
jgi:hypothetical protein